jgi:membrane associated rhomboid family serine protease
MSAGATYLPENGIGRVLGDLLIILAFFLPSFVTNLLLSRSAKGGILAGMVSNFFGTLYGFYGARVLGGAIAVGSLIPGAIFGAAGGFLGGYLARRRDKRRRALDLQPSPP